MISNPGLISSSSSGASGSISRAITSSFSRSRPRMRTPILTTSSVSSCFTSSFLLLEQRRTFIPPQSPHLQHQHQTASSWTGAVQKENTTNYNYANQKMLAGIPPMKRILCLCPVPITCSTTTTFPTEQQQQQQQQGGEYYNEKYSIGMAISDPYLAYAIPIQPQTTTTSSYEVTLERKTNHHGHNESLPIPSFKQQGFPNTLQELMHQCGYMDIGAIILGRPLVALDDCTTNNHNPQQQQQPPQKQPQVDENVKIVQDIMYSHFNNLLVSSQKDDKYDGTIPKMAALQGCFKLEEDDEQHDLVTLQDARKMAMEEPEMWEEIPLSWLDQDEQGESGVIVPPEIHAAVKLNVFLWRYTGGWRNTFA